MHSPLSKAPGRSRGRTIALWAGLAVGGVLPMVGCQAEYAGMTLPSGKYMHDDVQYFPPGPDFPWANTQAATQRARMQAQGIDVSNFPTGPAGPQTPPRAGGALNPANVNQSGVFGPNGNEIPVPPGGNVAPPVAPPGNTSPPPPGDTPVVPPPGADAMPK